MSLRGRTGALGSLLLLLWGRRGPWRSPSLLGEARPCSPQELPPGIQTLSLSGGQGAQPEVPPGSARHVCRGQPPFCPHVDLLQRTYVCVRVCTWTQTGTRVHLCPWPHFVLGGQACVCTRTLTPKWLCTACLFPLCCSHTRVHWCLCHKSAAVCGQRHTADRGLGFRVQEALVSVKSLDWRERAPAGLQAVGSLGRAQLGLLERGPKHQTATPHHEHGLVSRWHVGVPVLQGGRQEQLWTSARDDCPQAHL